MLAGLFTASPQACAANKIPNTNSFKDCRWGIFGRYLWDVQNAKNPEMDFPNRMGKTTDWDTCVREFDTEKFAQKIKETNAPYVFFTMMQRTRYLIAPMRPTTNSPATSRVRHARHGIWWKISTRR